AFLRALKTLDRLREPAKFGPWLLTIARNVATDILIARTRERNAGSPIPDEDDAVWLPNMEQREMWSKLHEQIRQLEDEPREVLMLFYFAGKRTKEIAALLNLSNDVVRKRLQRARETLGARLLDELQPERKLEPVLQKRSAAITAAALTAPVAWQSASAATISAGVGMALGKWFAGAVLVLAAGVAGIVALNRERGATGIAPPQPEAVYEDLLLDESMAQPAADRVNRGRNENVTANAEVAPTRATASTDVIHGHVVDEETGAGIGVAVELTGEIVGDEPIAADADERGAFSIDVSGCGYGSFAVNVKDTERYIASAAQGERRPGETTPEVLVRVRELATISGYVFRDDGSPVPQASIMRHELGARIDTKGSTDDNGYYEIRHDGGSLKLAARKGMLWSNFTDFELAKDESVTHDFVFPESGEIRITLHTPDDSVIEDLHDSALLTKGTTAPFLMAERIADNEFVVKNLPYDVYSIVLRAEGFEPAEIDDIALDEDAPTASVSVVLRRSVRYDVTVRVLDPQREPVSGASVVLKQLTERLDASGNVQAKLENQVGMNGRRTDSEGNWTTSVSAGSYRAFCAGQPTRGEVTFTVPDTSLATLQFTDPDPVNYRVEIVDGLDENARLSATDAYVFIAHADGTIEDRLAAGTNFVAVVKQGYTAYLDTITVNDPSSPEPTVIHAVLGAGGTVEGAARDIDGTPKIRHELMVFPELLWPQAASDGISSWTWFGLALSQRAQTDTEGNFSIGHLPEGRYIVALDEQTFSDPVDIVPGMVTGPLEIVAK
ncbi:MAG: sigma-70 family RNA polymerase sigma factor, partial [Candidatus Hydrogenedentes bacterium]|nr:sigma-70 family RNA polymerase sigma factor [Candidatus Hydrogenedentota bacterium]